MNVRIKSDIPVSYNGERYSSAARMSCRELLPTSMIHPKSIVGAQDVGRHYDQLDRFYREIWGEHVHHGLWKSGGERPEAAVVRLIEVVAQGARIASGHRVCDVGCGYGGTSRWLAETLSAHVVGFTVSAVQHAYAVGRNNGADNPEFHLCDWMENSLTDGSMDAVVSIECFTHVPDKLGFLRELCRVLKPGGRAAMTVWMHSEHPRDWQTRHLIEPICREGRLAGIGCASEYQTLMRHSGLVVERFEDWSRRVRKTWWICLSRLVGRLFTSAEYRDALFDKGLENRVFAITLARILSAYYLGVMRYGFFILRRDL